jgi:pimeloyl-ACP methyl ester carboxylesterase
LQPVRVASSDRLTSGSLFPAADAGRPLLVCLHGGGCNSGYFRIKGCSTLDRAIELGFSVLLVDRPGHGGNPEMEGDRPIARMGPVIRNFIDEVRHAHLARADGIVMIGQSIGGAVALGIASERGEWPLRALALSGIGDLPAPVVRQWWSAPDPELAPADDTLSLFLGPEGSYGWQGPIALRSCSEPWRRAEVAEVVRAWPARWPDVAGGVDVPVHLRLAQHDRLWETGGNVVERMAAALSNAPAVDAALLPDGGHLYEIHKRGPELIESQLGFLAHWAKIEDIEGLTR